MTAATPALPAESPPKSILELSHDKARAFLLKPESYSNLNLPDYIDFHKLIDDVRTAIGTHKLSDLSVSSRDCKDVNHTIFGNKDGKYTWRPYELIHPALYVSLVHCITEADNWKLIVDRFKDFTANNKIRCPSLPVVSMSDKKDKAEQILRWLQEVEQRSIELSLDYEYVIETDITDCYGSIYTHSIAWALHTKAVAKPKRHDMTLIGNIIDSHIRDMRHGQTNGIPQGSVLMDFVAEMVLGLGDAELSEKIMEAEIKDYCIVRYRDDYRIFVNNPQDGDRIMKLLTETTIGFGLKLNTTKTRVSGDVVRSSIKSDKRAWMGRKQEESTLQNRLLIIHDHAMQFPNGGSLMFALENYRKQLLRENPICKRPIPLIAIVTDIAYRNPRTHAVCVAILSVLLQRVDTDEERKKIVNRIGKRFLQIPNTGLMQIWLQRITYPFDKTIEYKEPLCALVAGDQSTLWNSDWISSIDLKNALDSRKIVNRTKLDEMDAIISEKEIELFAEGHYG